jgi:dGTPase
MSVGRKYPERSQIGFGDPFALDVIRITASNASRRLGEVAQVVPLADYSMSNRQNHTLCVASYSGYVSGILELNGNLTRAIALSHDLGQPAFAHAGESFLSSVLESYSRGKFAHEAFGAIVAMEIPSLNLTFEVADGIFGHSGTGNGPKGLTSEGRVVRIVDNIANLFEDIDSLSRNEIADAEISKSVRWFGSDVVHQIINTLNAFIQECVACNEVSFEKSRWAANFHNLRNAAYENLYPRVDLERDYVPQCLKKCLEVVSEHRSFRDCDPFAVVARLSDREAKEMAEKGRLNSPLVAEYVPCLRRLGEVKSFSSPDFTWAFRTEQGKLDL